MIVTNTPTLKPNGIDHLALSTTNMKEQLQFFNDVLGLPLKALYWMHGVEDTYHGFLELSPDSMLAFVCCPKNSSDIQYGVTHSGWAGNPVTGGAMQHLAFHVDTLDDLLAMRDRIRSHDIHVLGPADHGFCHSIYFAGPEGLALEITSDTSVDPDAWIDPEVVGLCGISDEELEVLKSPRPFVRPDKAVPQPPLDSSGPRLHLPPEEYETLMALPDEAIYNMFDNVPPVAV